MHRSDHDQGVHNLTHEVLTKYLTHMTSGSSNFYASDERSPELHDDLRSVGWKEIPNRISSRPNERHYYHPNHERYLHVADDDGDTGYVHFAHFGGLTPRRHDAS